MREAWAKVLTAELSEELVVREAQQRAELLSHKNLEEKAHLEEAKREKQRMSSEYQALAKQEQRELEGEMSAHMKIEVIL